jgi:hypothetical protein
MQNTLTICIEQQASGGLAWQLGAQCAAPASGSGGMTASGQKRAWSLDRLISDLASTADKATGDEDRWSIIRSLYSTKTATRSP